MPSSRPVKPSFSVVVALIEISSASIPMTAAIVPASRDMGFQFGTLRANSRIDIPDTVSFGRNQFHCLFQKNLAVDILVLSGSIRK